MDLNALIIKDVGEKSLELNPGYIKVIVLSIILIVMILTLKDGNKAPYIKYVVGLMIFMSILQGIVLYNHKDKNNYTLEIIDLQTKDVLSSKSITKEDSTFIKGLKLKRAKGQPISENEDKKLRLIINDMKPK